jgi:hypothetical protein
MPKLYLGMGGCLRIKVTNVAKNVVGKPMEKRPLRLATPNEAATAKDELNRLVRLHTVSRGM